MIDLTWFWFFIALLLLVWNVFVMRVNVGQAEDLRRLQATLLERPAVPVRRLPMQRGGES